MNKLAIVYSLLLLFFFTSCRPRAGQQADQPVPDTSQEKPKPASKPPGIYTDTLIIDTRAAVFYYPDSNQLKTLRADLGASVYDALVHEYYYQQRFAHTALQHYSPTLKILEARKKRFLVFVKADKSRTVIDLDTRNDLYGLFIFDPIFDPTLVDMTNAESQIGFYYSDAENIRKSTK